MSVKSEGNLNLSGIYLFLFHPFTKSVSICCLQHRIMLLRYNTHLQKTQQCNSVSETVNCVGLRLFKIQIET